MIKNIVAITTPSEGQNVTGSRTFPTKFILVATYNWLREGCNPVENHRIQCFANDWVYIGTLDLNEQRRIVILKWIKNVSFSVEFEIILEHCKCHLFKI